MKIRTKVAISILLVGLCILISYLVFLFLQDQRNKLLMESYREQLEASVTTAMAVNKTNLLNLVNDYSTWDEMVTFTYTRDPQWEKANLSTMLTIHNICALWIFNKDLNLIHTEQNNIESDLLPLRDLTFFPILKSQGTIHYYAMHGGVVFEFAAGTIHPTADTRKESDAAGLMIVCRYMDHSVLSNLEELSGAKVSVVTEESQPTEPQSKEAVDVNHPLISWNGKLIGTLRFERNQPMLQAFLSLTRITGLFYFIVALSILVFFSAVLFIWINLPLKKITRSLALEDVDLIKKIARSNNEFGLISRMIERFLAQKKELAAMIHENNEILVTLADSESNNRAILNAIPDHLIRINPGGVITHSRINKPQTLFIDPDGLPGKYYQDVLPASLEPQLKKAIDALIKNNHHQSFTFSHESGQNHVTYFEATISVTEDGGMLIIIRDITTRKEVELTLQRLLEKEGELNQLKTQFITTVSHEFRTPLSAILSNVQLLGLYEDRWPQDKKNTSLNRMIQAVNQMTILLDEVSIIGRHESGRSSLHPTIFNLADFMNDLIADSKTTLNPSAEIVCTYALNQQNVFMDKDLLRHIFSNLISNALKFTPADKSIFLSVKSDQDEMIRFVIEDQGIGIPDHEVEKIFDPFHRGENTRSIPGTGLGLSIVKRCIETHNGHISIKSQLGQGTTVTVFLPTFLNKPFQL